MWQSRSRNLLAVLALVAPASCSMLPQPNQPTLARARTLTLRGDGGGTVVSAPAGLRCPSTCAADFSDGAQVALTATSEPGWVFQGWSGACSGSDPVCKLTLNGSSTVGFVFKPAAPQACSGTQVMCAGQCTDLSTDINNCGLCDNACVGGELCQAGACTPSCDAAYQRCGTSCVDLTSDVRNCGGCDVACGPTQSCVNSMCVGSGNLQFSAMWSRPGNGDLLVKTPSGHTIFWDNVGPSPGTDLGQMDMDATDGVGPENVFWDGATTPMSGTYYLCFETTAFDPPPDPTNPVTATIRIEQAGRFVRYAPQAFDHLTSSNRTCDPTLDTFITSINYP
jgi:hypothetical protein